MAHAQVADGGHDLHMRRVARDMLHTQFTDSLQGVVLQLGNWARA
jgi:hypothetical protein